MTMRRCKKHIKGKRGEEFRQKIKGLKSGEIVGVGIDVSKSFHRVMVFNFDGEVLREPFEIDIFQAGYNKLRGEVKRVTREWDVKKVFWSMEPTGPYHQNVARHLVADGEEVIFMNPSQVAANREQTMLRGLRVTT